MYRPNDIVSDAINMQLSAPARNETIRFAQEIADAIRQSGIAELGGDFSWLRDKRILEGLALAHEAHGGKTRNYGGKSRLIHEVWGAHQVFNDKRVKTWLAREGLDPVTGAYVFVMHDRDENLRDLAEKAGVPFRRNASMRETMRVWGGAKGAWVIFKAIRFATDAPGLHGQERMDQQRAKSFDANGKCTSNVLEQAVRGYDKLSHVVFDAREWRTGNIPADKIAECRTQAEMKRWASEFPDVPLRGLYRQAQASLDWMPAAAQEITAPVQKTAAATALKVSGAAVVVAAFAYGAYVMMFDEQRLEKVWDLRRNLLPKSLSPKGLDH